MSCHAERSRETERVGVVVTMASGARRRGHLIAQDDASIKALDAQRRDLAFVDRHGNPGVLRDDEVRSVAPAELCGREADALDPYQILGVPRDADRAQILEAYRLQANLYRSNRIATLDVRPEVKRYAALQRSRIKTALAMLCGSEKAA